MLPNEELPVGRYIPPLEELPIREDIFPNG
jgi:hypothetical protein